MKIKYVILTLFIGLFLSSCGSTKPRSSVNPENLEKYDTVIYQYFDTVTTFMAYAHDEEEFNHYKEVLEKDLKTYHQFFNTYYDFDGVNNVKTINENAGKKPVKVDPAIIELLEYGQTMYKETDGQINIALGSLLGLWHDYREEAIENPDKAKVPSEKELKEAESHSDINKIEIDKSNNTVYITDPNIQIDIGAIGKGYAIAKIEKSLKEAGLKHGILSIGGDDVIIGKNPGKNDGLWKIAIQNPDLTAQNPYSSIIGITDTTVVTSGDYQRFYKVDDEIYHHIIDPDTMKPADYFRSVSVVHEDIALADLLSTYLFVVDLETGMEAAKKYGAEVLWIDKEDNYYKTPGWEAMED